MRHAPNVQHATIMDRASTTMKWLRLYTEARTDNKLRSLSDRQFRIWFNMLCLAAEQSDRGVISGYDEHLLAIEVAGGDVEALRETCNALQALRSVTAVTCDDGTLLITFRKFAERQYIKPSDAPERVRDRVNKYRQNKKLREQNSGETPLKRDVTPCNAPETPPETDSDCEREDAGANDLPENGETDEPIGANTAAEVRETVWVAEQHWPMSSVRIQARQWLAKKPAALIIAAMNAAHEAKARKPGRYIETLLDDPDFGKPKPPPRRGARPEPARMPKREL